MFRKEQENPRTCWSIFLDTLSQLNPKKMFIFYLLLSAPIIKAENIIAERRYLKDSADLIEEKGDVGVGVLDANRCKLVMQDPFTHESGKEIYRLDVECAPKGSSIELSSMKEQNQKNRYEGHFFQHGRLESNLKDNTARIVTFKEDEIHVKKVTR